jgi:hypothetical protein
VHRCDLQHGRSQIEYRIEAIVVGSQGDLTPRLDKFPQILDGMRVRRGVRLAGLKILLYMLTYKRPKSSESELIRASLFVARPAKSF